MKNPTFDNQFLKSFPEIATRVQTTPVSAPELLTWSEDVGQGLLGLETPTDPRGVEARIFAGNELAPGMETYATRYGGHQFGHWAGQLGDGRAILLGEAVTSTAPGRWEIQLKGAGQTPYSRRGDGRAVLRSSLREFLCSEAMHFLGVPTTRALCCVLTGDSVVRDMFYDGHPQAEPGAITTRVAPSFLRLGHFQILAADQNTDLLDRLVGYSMKTYFPELGGDRARWFEEICRRTASLMVHWQRVGFVHGVMNTDNLSILGLTIDYGPYGWMDIYDPDWTPNTTDEETRRYRFGQQPAIALWNLKRFAEALALLTPDDTEWLRQGLETFASAYNEEVLQMMGRKLGLRDFPLELVTKLDQAMRSTETDMTIFYRELARVRRTVNGEAKDPSAALEMLRPAFYTWPLAGEASEAFKKWLADYLDLTRKEHRNDADVADEMNRVNPFFILRNYLAQEALDAIAKGDRGVMERLQRALRTPYEENDATREFHRKMPDWARNRPGCSALSCSS